MPTARPALSPPLGWTQWLASLLLGLMLVLLVLIASWLLRAFAPVDPLLNVTMLETAAPPAAQPPPDNMPALRGSLDQTMVDGKTLAGELASLQAELKSKVASCKPIERPKTPALPADRWAKKDLDILKGCWVLGHDVRSWRGEIGTSGREADCTTKAGRMCFDANGHGKFEATTVCPIAGTIYCARPMTAQFANDGTFATMSPETQCQRGPPTRSEYLALSCRRIDDYRAMCRKTNFSPNDQPGTLSVEHEFRREQ